MYNEPSLFSQQSGAWPKQLQSNLVNLKSLGLEVLFWIINIYSSNYNIRVFSLLNRCFGCQRDVSYTHPKHVIDSNADRSSIDPIYLWIQSRKYCWLGLLAFNSQGTKIFQYCTSPAGWVTFNFHSSCKKYAGALKVYAIKNIRE